MRTGEEEGVVCCAACATFVRESMVGTVVRGGSWKRTEDDADDQAGWCGSPVCVYLHVQNK